MMFLSTLGKTSFGAAVYQGWQFFHDLAKLGVFGPSGFASLSPFARASMRLATRAWSPS